MRRSEATSRPRTIVPADVLYVSYDGLLEPLGASQVIPYVRRLAARGYAMEVLSFEKPGDLDDRGRMDAVRRRLATDGIGWHARRYHRRPSLPATLYDVAVGSAFCRRWRRSGSSSGMRLIHARSYVAAMMGLAAKSASRVGLLFDTRSFLVDERIDSGIWARDSLVTRIARRVERRLLAQADAIVVVAARGAAALPNVVEPTRTRVRVIPPAADLQRFRPPQDAVTARAAVGIRNGPVLMHVGALSTWYLGEQTFAVGKEFVRQSGGSFVVLTKEIDVARRLDARTGAGALIQFVDHEDMPRWLAAADAGLALVRPDPAKCGSMPVKVGEYLACGMAVAATHHIGDLDEQLDGRVAFTCDPADTADSVVARLLTAVRSPSRVSDARGLAQRYYSLDDAVDAYAATYRDLGVAPSADAPASREAS